MPLMAPFRAPARQEWVQRPTGSQVVSHRLTVRPRRPAAFKARCRPRNKTMFPFLRRRAEVRLRQEAQHRKRPTQTFRRSIRPHHLRKAALPTGKPLYSAVQKVVLKLSRLPTQSKLRFRSPVRQEWAERCVKQGHPDRRISGVVLYLLPPHHALPQGSTVRHGRNRPSRLAHRQQPAAAQAR